MHIHFDYHVCGTNRLQCHLPSLYHSKTPNTDYQIYFIMLCSDLFSLILLAIILFIPFIVRQNEYRCFNINRENGKCTTCGQVIFMQVYRCRLMRVYSSNIMLIPMHLENTFRLIIWIQFVFDVDLSTFLSVFSVFFFSFFFSISFIFSWGFHLLSSLL